MGLLKARPLLLWFGLTASVWTIFVQAQPLPIKYWTTADGLVHNRIIRIRRDSRGFLWFCTQEGLSLFDGRDFTTFDTLNGLPHLTVTDLLQTRDGSYWVTTDGGGIARFFPSANCCTIASDKNSNPDLKIYTIGEQLAQNRVNTVFEDHAGRIYAGTDDGAFRLEGKPGQERFRRLDPEKSPDSLKTVTSFTEDSMGNLWIGSWNGLARVSPDGKFIRWSVRPVQKVDYVTAVITDGKGKVWIGARYAGIIVIDPAELTLPEQQGSKLSDLKTGIRRWFTQRDGLPDLDVWSLHQSSDGVIWIGTEGRLTSCDGDRLRVIGDPKGINKTALAALAEDAAGNIWAGSNSGALQVIRGGIAAWSAASGLSNELPQAIFEGRDGAVHIITSDSKINRFDGEGFRSAPFPAPSALLYYESNLATLQDRQGEWWMPVREGLWRFPRADGLGQFARLKTHTVYDQRNGLPPFAVARVFEDSHGDIWCSMSGEISLVRLDRRAGRFRQFGETDGVPSHNGPTSFSEDRSGTIWAGLGAGGLLRYRNGKFKLFTAQDGLPGGGIQCLRLDRRGRLWMGSTTGGAACIETPEEDSPHFKRYTRNEGLSSDNVLSLAEGADGHIYFGTGRGLDMLPTVGGRVYSWLGSHELKFSDVSVLLADRNGYLWVGGLGGLLRLPENKNPQSTPIYITNVSAGDALLRLPPGGVDRVTVPELTMGQNRLRIDFTSGSFLLGERPLFQVKLAGVDADWSAPMTQHSVAYANLPPDNYLFLIRRISARGRFDDTLASVSVTVLPPLWRRWWFLMLATLIVGLLIYAAARYRFEQRLAVERVRTRLATDLHDDIGASLSEVAILSEVVNRRVVEHLPVTESLAQIGEVSREMLDAMNDIVWANNPRYDSLTDLTQRLRHFAVELLEARGIEFKLSFPDESVDPQLGAEVRQQVFLIGKEAINNLARHSSATTADIELMIEDRSLILRVADNGCGFAPFEAKDGNGLRSMRSRAVELGGELAIASTPGGGAQLILRVPLSKDWKYSHLFRWGGLRRR